MGFLPNEFEEAVLSKRIGQKRLRAHYIYTAFLPFEFFDAVLNKEEQAKKAELKVYYNFFFIWIWICVFKT